MNHFPIHNSSIHEWAEGIMIPYFEETTHLYCRSSPLCIALFSVGSTPGKMGLPGVLPKL